MNHIEEVAKILGVEIGEEFTLEAGLETGIDTYRFTETGIFEVLTPFSGWAGCDGSTLLNILYGYYKITKKPWKPNEGERYWFIGKDGEVASSGFYPWNYTDLTNYKIGNMYSTAEEAKAHTNEWAAWFASDERANVLDPR